AVNDRFAAVAGNLSGLAETRANALDSRYPADSTFADYSRTIQDLMDLGEQAITTLTDPGLIRLQSAANAVARAEEQASLKRGILLQAFATKTVSQNQYRALLAADVQFDAARSDFVKSAAPDQRRLLDDTVTAPAVEEAGKLESAVLARATGNGKLDDVNSAQWDTDSTKTVDLTNAVQKSLLGQLRSQTDELAAISENSAIRNSALVLGALLLALLTALFVSRSLLLPLRVLRRTALDIADHRLPEEVQRILTDPHPKQSERDVVEPVPVYTTEEVGQLARAFDAVHGEAVRMAAQQALLRDNVNAMFVNLSRRSQALVERQLGLIDRLEQDEENPDQLASLFELDHLATRMRRNSENLLVLSGTDLGRRLTSPVPVADVIGAAVSEVEQYARIQVAPTPELAVQGQAVNDVVHLIAELLDNATVFSAPETKVTVHTARTRRGELALEIHDRGVGMSASDVEDVNLRLVEPPEVDVAVSRRMGLYVVARLAKRHDIRVRLRTNADADGGTTALVVVPSSLVVVPGEAPAGTQVERPPAQVGRGIANAFGMARRTPQPAVEPVAAHGGYTSEAELTELSVRIVPRAGEQSATEIPHWLPLTVVPADQGQQWPTDDEPPGTPIDLFAGFQDTADSVDSAEDHTIRGTVLPPGDGPPSGYGHPRPATRTATGGPPVLDAPEADRVPGTDSEALTEHLPIYQSILSQWFQEVENETPDLDSPFGVPAQPGAPLANSSAGPATASMAEGVGSALPAGGDAGHGTTTQPAVPSGRNPGAVRRTAPPRVPARTRNNEWASPGDEGWQAAAALLDRVADTMTSAGLPKRVPKAYLIPGSAAPRSSTVQPTRAPTTPRSADSVRGRMSSFQQGVRRGRHALIDAYSGDARPSPQSSEDEEQE
ncbi:MAG: nitrate- and nitrite sensing domain-containing protein, partial [Kutzneria sp.]|nr:nitrate- and nitrite sensing domain-containing protein [Kutzneria sp.]